MSNATIYDIAREAGVSIATVSQVINGKGKISDKRRQEIYRIMEELNYRPSVIASALTGKSTFTLGLLIPDISNPFFAEMARAVEDCGSRSKYSLVICSTDNKDEKVSGYLELLQQKSVDGIIIGTGVEDRDLLTPLLHKSIPIVMIAREMPGIQLPTVIVDDYAGGKKAAEHLLGLRHRSMAIITEPTKVSSSRERLRGFRDAIMSQGLELPDEMVKKTGENLLKDGKSRALELLAGSNPPSAIFCCNDLIAIGTLQAAKELGIRVPEQLSIVGFDNTILASVTEPALTTISQPTEKMGSIAVETLIRLLEGDSTAEEQARTILTPELVIRSSTASAFAGSEAHP
ncbi:LacI family DNA-binding transcriptional regulator [Paenibacillus spongiae]|uniref:LacI family transcriptional regulator n=1 Tax=Paenibacillus spongiae TaxID=2909671 RepID=A0ABY5SBT9_9BACL|nr:LacI family DNA-binding transcriptional regulator [Paenibacillus spongiae]UVI31397.1 LacI family transcriptional regulator [Paenibacillus spongiae]